MIDTLAIVLDRDKGLFGGYAVAFGNTGRGRIPLAASTRFRYVVPRPFSQRSDGLGLRILFQHDKKQEIGRVLKVQPTAQGLMMIGGLYSGNDHVMRQLEALDLGLSVSDETKEEALIREVNALIRRFTFFDVALAANGNTGADPRIPAELDTLYVRHGQENVIAALNAFERLERERITATQKMMPQPASQANPAARSAIISEISLTPNPLAQWSRDTIRARELMERRDLLWREMRGHYR